MTKAHPHRQVNVHLDTVDDADVIERIEAQPSMVGYVRELVRRDIHDERLDCVALKTSELQSENAKLRELVRELWEGYMDPQCEDCPLKNKPACADCPICAREAAVIDRMRELGVEVD